MGDVSQDDDWFQLRHHVGAWLYQSAYDNNIAFNVLTNLHHASEIFEIKMDGMSTYRQIKKTLSGNHAPFTGVKHGMGWQAFVNAKVPPQKFWDWAISFRR